MKLVNLETGIIFDGYEFDDAIEFPHVVSIGVLMGILILLN